MALEPEDVKVLQQMIDDGARKACAGAMRVVAHLERDQAVQLALLELADGVQAGNVPIPGGELRAVLVPEEAAEGYLDELAERERPSISDDEPEREAPALWALEADGDAVYVVDPVAGSRLPVFPPHMGIFIEQFDDRLRSSEHFIPAMNEAAAAGRRADHETARMVADRVRELAEGGS